MSGIVSREKNGLQQKTFDIFQNQLVNSVV
jgi:hypothetical protein